MLIVSSSERSFKHWIPECYEGSIILGDLLYILRFYSVFGFYFILAFENQSTVCFCIFSYRFLLQSFKVLLACALNDLDSGKNIIVTSNVFKTGLDIEPVKVFTVH